MTALQWMGGCAGVVLCLWGLVLVLMCFSDDENDGGDDENGYGY